MEYSIQEMKSELATRIEDYLNGRLEANELKVYANQQELRWAGVDDATLPPHGEDDRIYWAAIYDVSTLNDQPPEHHTTDADLHMHFQALRGEIPLPADHHAFRPTRGVQNSEAYQAWERTQPKPTRRLPP